MKTFFFLLQLLLGVAINSAAQAATVSLPADFLGYEPPGWYSVGGDPCRDNPDCTAERTYRLAAERGLLPKAVADEAIRRFAQAEAMVAAGEEPDWHIMQVCHGDHMFMTFGREHFRFVDHITARFQGCTEAKGFVIWDNEQAVSHLIFRVTECGNYGGRTVIPTFTSASTWLPSLVSPSVNGLPAAWTPVPLPVGGRGGLPPIISCCGVGNPVHSSNDPGPSVNLDVPVLPQPIIPLPATLWFLLGAFALLCLLRRGRRFT